MAWCCMRRTSCRRIEQSWGNEGMVCSTIVPRLADDAGCELERTEKRETVVMAMDVGTNVIQSRKETQRTRLTLELTFLSSSVGL